MSKIINEYTVSIISSIIGAIVTIISVIITFNYNTKESLNQKRRDVMPFLNISMEDVPKDTYDEEPYVANEFVIINDNSTNILHLDPAFIAYKVSEYNVHRSMKSRVKAVVIKNIGMNTSLGIIVKNNEEKLSNKTNLCVGETYKAIWMFNNKQNSISHNIILEFADIFGNLYNQMIELEVGFDKDGYGFNRLKGTSNPPTLIRKVK